MRVGCLDCVRKHLGQASVLMDEARLGYPSHRWLAVGHMAEAESEMVEINAGLAHRIRDHRLAYIADEDYRVPILTLIEEVGRG